MASGPGAGFGQVSVGLFTSLCYRDLADLGTWGDPRRLTAWSIPFAIAAALQSQAEQTRDWQR